MRFIGSAVIIAAVMAFSWFAYERVSKDVLAETYQDNKRLMAAARDLESEVLQRTALIAKAKKDLYDSFKAESERQIIERAFAPAAEKVSATKEVIK